MRADNGSLVVRNVRIHTDDVDPFLMGFASRRYLTVISSGCDAALR
jgi:hypothetical protein